MVRRVARIRKRGAFLKEWEKCKRPWPEFSLFLNQNHTVCPKIATEFLGKLGNSIVFSAQNQVVSKKKKKKGLHRNWDWFFGQNRKFKRFSFLKQVVSNKKKRSSPKLRLIFRPKLEIQTLFQAASRHILHNFGTQFPLGGLFSIFHQKSASKAPKTCNFAYFTSQWGGLEPPPRPPWLRYWVWSKM